MSLVLLGLLGALCLPGSALARAAETGDSCVDCHSDPRFLVTNKKLYDYFQEWSVSVHRQEEVTCVDCHGGNPGASDKKGAHGQGVSSNAPGSGIYYKKIPKTCGACHEEVLDGFLKSNHYQHVSPDKDNKQGPTCVTCHGSINVAILKVGSVEAACARCHNDETDNHPEIPDQAYEILNRFLSIHRFYRYIAKRAEPAEAKEFFGDMDVRLNRLSITWHTFDLDKIDEETSTALLLLKAKRNEIRARYAARRLLEEQGGGAP